MADGRFDYTVFKITEKGEFRIRITGTDGSSISWAEAQERFQATAEWTHDVQPDEATVTFEDNNGTMKVIPHIERDMPMTITVTITFGDGQQLIIQDEPFIIWSRDFVPTSFGIRMEIIGRAG